MTKKQRIRAMFRNEVFSRDGHCCKICKSTDNLDAHHIVDRHDAPDGGYTKDNGITLCGNCHLKAEQFHITGVSLPGFSPEELISMVGLVSKK